MNGFIMRELRKQCLNKTATALKHQTYAAVDHSAVERCPRVDGPPAIDAARRSQQSIPAGLRDVRQVLAVDEQQQATDAPAQ